MLWPAGKLRLTHRIVDGEGWGRGDCKPDVEVGVGDVSQEWVEFGSLH